MSPRIGRGHDPAAGFESRGAGDEVVDRIRFQTETGSIFELTRTRTGAMYWQRLSATLASGVLRTDGGRLLAWPEVVIGARCQMLSEPIDAPFPRGVATSFVVARLDEGGRVLPVAAAAARRTFRYLRVGDHVTRLVGGQRMGSFEVTAVDATLVHCGPWTFDRVTGIEVDPDLGLGPGGLIGTWLIHSDSEDDRW